MPNADQLNTTLRILVIDDDPFIQMLTVHMLRQLGYEQLEKASDGADAIRKVKVSLKPFDLIICDLNMPVMDGFDFMHAAQQIHYKGALIILSSDALSQLKAAVKLGIACGLNVLGALHKPLEREALQEMLMKYKALPAQ